MANREVFLKKLESYKVCVQAITQEAHGIIQSDTRNKLTELQKNISDLYQRVKGNLFEIAIVGLEKAGKSTFANALIGFDILPTKEERCTYTSSCVKYADSTYAEVEFFTQEEFNLRFAENLKSLGVSDDYSYGSFSEQQLNALIGDKTLTPDQTNIREDVEDMIKSYSDISFWLGKGTKRFSDLEMKEAEFKNLIQNPDRQDGRYVQKPTFAVKKITIYSHNLGEMRNCEIYDVPGFDSPTAIHIEQTKERMNLADVVILIANASKPSLTGPQLKIFRTEVDSDGVPFNEKIFVFANRADESKNEFFKGNIERLRDELSKYGILKSVNSDRLIPGSAFAYLAKQGVFSGEHAEQALANIERNGITSGIVEIKDGLERYNEYVRIRVVEQRVRNIEKRIKEVAEEVKILCGDIMGGNNSSSEMAFALIAAKGAFKEKILTYRSVMNRFLTEKPFTQRIMESFSENLNAESFYPDNEEIERLKNIEITGKKEVEIALRTSKHNQIKKELKKTALCISDDLDRDTRNGLTQCLIEALGITPDHRYYEALKQSAREYIDNYFSRFHFDSIYDALYARFLNEVFTLLITKLYLDDDRWEYFMEKMENIVYLALYTDEVRNKIRVNRPVYSDDLPLIRKMLFHEETHSGASEETKAVCISETAAIIRSKTNSLNIPVSDYAETMVVGVIESNIPLDVYIQTLKTTMPDMKPHRYDEAKEQEAVKYYLNQVTEKLKTAIPKESDKKYIPLSERYKTAMRSRDNSYEWITKSFNDDIRILFEVISESLVKAIQLEVPFVANTMDIIYQMDEDIKDKNLKTGPFGRFFEENYEKIEYVKFEESEALREKNEAKRRIHEKINEIIQEIN